MLILTSILVYNEYFHITKVICARNLQTVRKRKPKTWPQISSPGSEFWVRVLWFLIPSPGSWILDQRFQVLHPTPWFQDLRSGSWFQVRSVIITVWQNIIAKCNSRFFSIITKCDRKVITDVIGITKGDRKFLQREICVTKCDYKILHVLESVTIITKWDVTHALNNYWANRPDALNNILGILIRLDENQAALTRYI